MAQHTLNIFPPLLKTGILLTATHKKSQTHVYNILRTGLALINHQRKRLAISFKNVRLKKP